MGETMHGMKRTHMCAEVTEKFVGQRVTVMGWVNKRRNLGQLIFISLRDRSGLVQGVIDENSVSAELFSKVSHVRGEFVLAFSGEVKLRAPENVNEDMETGKIEIAIDEFRVLSEAEVPPFQVTDQGVKEDLRLKHRYIDLRRPELQKNFILRHNVSKSVRDYLSGQGFLEVETPILTKSTPEGARDYLVPSRVHPGNFYALPQSPQQFKQMLMISGFDKYFQIVKCFRDEDLRADRQPEFTQIDIEMSFVDEEDVITFNEGLMKTVFSDVAGVELEMPLPRMSFGEAMERYGSDKPDIRFGLELKNITNLVSDMDFPVFQEATQSSGSVRGICAAGCAKYSRKQIDSLVEFVKTYKAKGLVWISLAENGEIKSSAAKFFTDEKMNEVISAFGAVAGDLILICAGDDEIVFDSLGALRCEIAKREELTKDNDYKLLWTTDFPLLEWNEEDDRFYARHHPFTSPKEEDMDKLDTDPRNVRAKAYDLVANGYELAGGSIRIYQNDVQLKMFEKLGFTKEAAEERFGYFLEAFKYGTPPHGGIAYGLDRLVMLLAHVHAIRDVIAFPKVKDASCPLTDSPGEVEQTQLDELGLSIVNQTVRGENVENN